MNSPSMLLKHKPAQNLRKTCVKTCVKPVYQNTASRHRTINNPSINFILITIQIKMSHIGKKACHIFPSRCFYDFWEIFFVCFIFLFSNVQVFT